MTFKKTIFMNFILLFCSVMMFGGCSEKKESIPESSAVMVEPLTEEEIVSAFLKARDASMWDTAFAIEDISENITMDVDRSIQQDGREYAPYTYNGLTTYTELEVYLKQIFTEELVEKIKTPQPDDYGIVDFTDIDDQFYVNAVWDWRDTAETKNIVITPQEDGSYDIAWTLLKYDGPPEALYFSGEEESVHFTYAYTDAGWRFTDFSLPEEIFFNEDRSNLWIVYGDENIPALNPDAVKQKYADALYLYSWFGFNPGYSEWVKDIGIAVSEEMTFDLWGDYVNKEGGYYVKINDSRLNTMEELESLLKIYFSDEMASNMIAEGPFEEFDGELYYLDGARGVDVNYGDSQYISTVAVNAGESICTILVDEINPSSGQVLGLTVLKYPLRYLAGDWKFTEFPFVY